MNDGWDLVKELTDDEFVMQKSFDEYMSRLSSGSSGWAK
jgi:hypothetical protein